MLENKEFDVYFLNDKGIRSANEIAILFDCCLTNVLNAIDNAEALREIALVKTKMQEACFFAKRAMAMNEDNQLTDAETNDAV